MKCEYSESGFCGACDVCAVSKMARDGLRDRMQAEAEYLLACAATELQGAENRYVPEMRAFHLGGASAYRNAALSMAERLGFKLPTWMVRSAFPKSEAEARLAAVAHLLKP